MDFRQPLIDGLEELVKKYHAAAQVDPRNNVRTPKRDDQPQPGTAAEINRSAESHRDIYMEMDRETRREQARLECLKLALRVSTLDSESAIVTRARTFANFVLGDG